MSYKIVQPSTNSDRVTRFGVTSGTADNVITFPNESGEIAVTTDIPAVTIPPPTIYQTDENLDDVICTSTTYQHIPGTVVTGLESNYLYEVKLFGEISQYNSAYVHNFKMRIRTSGGSKSTLTGNSSNLWLAFSGGMQANIGTGFIKRLYPVDYNIYQDAGWNIRESETNGLSGKVNLHLLYATGTTSDSRSFRFEIAISDTPSEGEEVSWIDSETTIIAIPIKSLV